MRNISEGFQNHPAQKVESPQGDTLPFAVVAEGFRRILNSWCKGRRHWRKATIGRILKMSFRRLSTANLGTASWNFHSAGLVPDIPTGEEGMVIVVNGRTRSESRSEPAFA
jgi:hypothetical protein